MRISLTIWFVWYFYWIVSASQRVRHTEDSPARREPLAGRLGYLALMSAGFLLIFWHVPLSSFERFLWASSLTSLYAGLAIQAAGLAFAVWARLTLGRNWAARITVGASQQLITQGPYRLVRHPIYSGLLFGVLGTAIIVGQVRALVGFLVVLISVLIKVRREEKALRQHFGATYQDYAQRVPALLPGLL